MPCPDGAPTQRAVAARAGVQADALDRGVAGQRAPSHRALALRHQPLELRDDRRQPVERRLGPQELAVGPRRMAAERRARRDVAEDGALGRDPAPGRR